MEKAALEYLTEHPLDNILATKIITDALNFRIAKPPIKKTNEKYKFSYKYGFSYYCPTCGREDVGHYQYCPDCGQNLYWEV